MTEVSRPYIRIPDDWEPFVSEIVEDPFVLDGLEWKEVGSWGDDAHRWRVRGRWRKREGSPWVKSPSESRPARFEIDFKFNRTPDIHAADKEGLRTVLEQRLRRRLTGTIGRDGALPRAQTVHISWLELPPSSKQP